MSGGWRPSLGAVFEPSGTTFRVWAPKPKRVELLLRGLGGEGAVTMERHGEYAVARVPAVRAGDRYAYRLDDNGPVPDPCSRSQPDGVHGWSEIVDPWAFRWSDANFEPPPPDQLVIYECHIGTLTQEGTFEAAIAELSRIAALGVTALEVMPVASFPGRWNWGYDGVALFAPSVNYGGPDGMRRLVDAAHGAGLAVILDVVYNHFGPDGNYTGRYSSRYLTGRHKTPWGDAINLDDKGASEVRRFIMENLLHWQHEYHIDGFRFDAADELRDDSRRHVLAQATETVATHHRGARPPIMTAEIASNDPRYVTPLSAGGCGLDAVWADDFHHAARTLTGLEREGYLRMFGGTVTELARTIEQGWLYEGEENPANGRPRGHAARDIEWWRFIYCLQNHDQVGNRAFGDRIASQAGREAQLALTVLLLLLPQTPLLFEGQEWCTTRPFLFFSDHEDRLGKAITAGRREEFRDFRAFSDPLARAAIPDPQAESTYRASQLDRAMDGAGAGAQAADFHRELLRLRREDPVLRASRAGRPPLRAVVEAHCLVVRIENVEGRRAIVINPGTEARQVALELNPSIVISSADDRWGGQGEREGLDEGMLTLPGHTGVFLSLAD